MNQTQLLLNCLQLKRKSVRVIDTTADSKGCGVWSLFTCLLYLTLQDPSNPAKNNAKVTQGWKRSPGYWVVLVPFQPWCRMNSLLPYWDLYLLYYTVVRCQPPSHKDIISPLQYDKCQVHEVRRFHSRLRNYRSIKYKLLKSNNLIDWWRNPVHLFLFKNKRGKY